nr:phage tail tube protein [uncultured Mediterranean phage uvMED]|tara:strand:+ start:4949 stop:5620 length:672 start_codon:yes stop_codon:yes gene_type:complete
MSNLRTLTSFKSALLGGGARPNLFEVSIPTFPTAALQSIPNQEWNAAAQTDLNFMCKAAQLPASNIASIDIPFRGRTLKVAGDRTIENWTITIINDENFSLRTKFEIWMNGIAKLDDNTGATSPGAYMADAYVYQLGRGYANNKHSTTNGGVADAGAEPPVKVNPLRSYTFHSIFPVNVSAIDLSYDSSDTIEEFTVEFAVQSISANGGTGETDQNGVTINGF